MNRVQLIGFLGKDPEVKFLKDGQTSVALFSVATTESWKDKDGNKVEKTEWHNIVAYRWLAENAGKTLKKGSLVFVEGKVTCRNWDKGDGTKGYITEVIATNLQLCVKAEGNRAPAPQEEYHSAASPANASEGQQAPPPVDDNDLPF